jgi:hypothetical protein
MVAPWFRLSLDPARRLLLAGGGGEVAEVLAEPPVKRERMWNMPGAGEREIWA